MVSSSDTYGLKEGDLLEARVARAWYWDGYLVRNGVDLRHKYGESEFSVTDLDVFGLQTSQNLQQSLHIGEVKSGRGKNAPKALDRAMWLAGLARSVGASRTEITLAQAVSTPVRNHCETLDCTVQDVHQLEAREARLGIADVGDYGSVGPRAFALGLDVERISRTEKESSRVVAYLRGEMWLEEPFQAVKTLIPIMDKTASDWAPKKLVEANLLDRWIFAESFIALTSRLVELVSIYVHTPVDKFHEVLRFGMGPNGISYDQAVLYSRRVDDYVYRVLTKAGISEDVAAAAMGAFYPESPSYLETLAELIRRLAEDADNISQLARQADMLIFESMINERAVPDTILQRLGIDENTYRYLRLIRNFLSGIVRIPDGSLAVLDPKE
ncbi:hypothetical protein SAMN04487849_101318 [Micrococcus luteus]|uniref:Uncharacterized protein n=1 Tax=Micrococcus luteus TaxID=1270 RepID=A0ABD7M5S1_MICLU|nr:hypothetical protein [Micrococcus luteus]SHL33425.1 hypothetical protein SAMN04487849_101318 [Micrococcus luteus]